MSISISAGSRPPLGSTKADQVQVKPDPEIQSLSPGSAEKDDTTSVSEKAVIEAIEKANKITLTHNTRAEFSVHEVTKSIMVKIIDTESNEVIREFPPKKFLDLIAKLWDLAGIVVDERR